MKKNLLMAKLEEACGGKASVGKWYKDIMDKMGEKKFWEWVYEAHLTGPGIREDIQYYLDHPDEAVVSPP
jgi:hypothetical protein